MIENLNAILKRTFPRTHAWLRSRYFNQVESVVREVRMLRRGGIQRYITSRRTRGAPWEEALPVQLPRRINIPFATLADLKSTLEYLKLTFKEGAHALYIPPESLRALKFLNELSYPSRGGLKIVKHSGLGREASYLNEGIQHSKLMRSLTYPAAKLTLVANFLYQRGLGPKLIDFVELLFREGSHHGYLIDHVISSTLTSDKFDSLLSNLRELESNGVITITTPGGFAHSDFMPPDGNGNIHFDDSSKRALYIDFQNFILPNYGEFLNQLALTATNASHFGDPSIVRGGRYLYQSVPGTTLIARRDCKLREAVILRLLAESKVSIAERIVLDIGCNIGMMSAFYLSQGAFWCHGWDMPEVTPHTSALLNALGCTRFSLSSGLLNSDSNLAKDIDHIPNRTNMIISYLAVRRHLGWLPALTNLQWSTMIYEGHEDETLDEYLNDFARQCPIRILAQTTYSDGDSGKRPIAIITRE